MATKSKKRFGLLTFAHGTFYGLQLLQHEINSHISSSANIVSKDFDFTTVDNGGTADSKGYNRIQNQEQDSPDSQVNESRYFKNVNCDWECATCITCEKCPIFRPYALCIMGLFQITPQAIQIFKRKNDETTTIISFIAWLLSTSIALIYYAKFLYHYAYKKDYKFTILDDIQFDADKMEMDTASKQLYKITGVNVDKVEVFLW